MATLTPLVGPTCQSPLSLHLLSLHSPRPAAAGAPRPAAADHLGPPATPPHPVAGPRHRRRIRARARRRRWIRSRPSSGRPDPRARASSSTAAGELLRHHRGRARSSSTATAMAARSSHPRGARRLKELAAAVRSAARRVPRGQHVEREEDEEGRRTRVSRRRRPPRPPAAPPHPSPDPRPTYARPAAGLRPAPTAGLRGPRRTRRGAPGPLPPACAPARRGCAPGRPR